MQAEGVQPWSYSGSLHSLFFSPPVRLFGRKTRHEQCLLCSGSTDEGLVASFEPWRCRIGLRLLSDAFSTLVVFTSRHQRGASLRLSRRRVASDPCRFSNSHGVRSMATQTNEVVLQSVLTCPECGHVAEETMPTDACQWFYECTSCHTVLKPVEGDCCVYCSYATVPCPPIQEGKSCCA